MKIDKLAVYQLLCIVLLGAVIAISIRNNNHINAPEVEATTEKAPDSLGWRRIKAAEMTENPFTLFSDDWMLLSVGTPDDMNTMTIGWGGLGILWGHNNPVVTVYVEKSRYTHEFMERNEYFTLTAFTNEYRGALQYLGSHSGRDGDKISTTGLTVDFTDMGNPYFKEARLVIECKKIYADPFNPEGLGERGKSVYANGRQLHTVYIGEIINVWTKE